MNTQQQILEELKTMNTNMQNIKGTIKKTNTPKKACYYPQTQAIEHTPSYLKAMKGMKTGRNFMLAGVAIAAGLSNGLSALNLIPEYTYGIYGGIIAFGITTTIVGVITTAVYAIKSGIKDNPNLIKNTQVRDAYNARPYGGYGYSAAYYTNPHRV